MLKKNRGKSSKRQPTMKKKTKQLQKTHRKVTSIILGIRQALYRKYSSSQNHYYLRQNNTIILSHDQQSIQKVWLTWQSEHKQWLTKYCNKIQRSHLWAQIKQIYEMHAQIPRIFQQNIISILNKCYYRKRLLEYFRIAKVLGIHVDSVKFSTFILSITRRREKQSSQWEPIIQEISNFQFSQEEIQRKLLDLMENKENYENYRGNVKKKIIVQKQCNFLKKQ